LTSQYDAYYQLKQGGSVDRTLVKRNFVSNATKLPNFKAILEEVNNELEVIKKEKSKELLIEKKEKEEAYRKLLLCLRGPAFAAMD